MVGGAVVVHVPYTISGRVCGSFQGQIEELVLIVGPVSISCFQGLEFSR